jgi:hypothetical protein
LPVTIGAQESEIVDLVVKEISVNVIDVQTQRLASPCPIDAADRALMWNTQLQKGAHQHARLFALSPRVTSDENFLCGQSIVRYEIPSPPHEVRGV